MKNDCINYHFYFAESFKVLKKVFVSRAGLVKMKNSKSLPRRRLTKMVNLLADLYGEISEASQRTVENSDESIEI